MIQSHWKCKRFHQSNNKWKNQIEGANFQKPCFKLSLSCHLWNIKYSPRSYIWGNFAAISFKFPNFHVLPPTLYHPPKRQSTKEYFGKLEIAVWQEALITVQSIVECVKVMDENLLSAFPLLAFRTETHAAVLTLKQH